MSTTIPASDVLATLSRAELQTLCGQHQVTLLQGDGPSMMRRALAARRDGQRMPGRVEPIQAPAASPTPEPDPQSKPIAGPAGTPRVWVMTETAAGRAYRPASATECLAAAFATAATVGDVDALLDACSALGEQHMARVKAATPPAKVGTSSVVDANGKVVPGTTHQVSQRLTHECPAPGTELPPAPVEKPEQLVTLPPTSNPDPKPLPAPKTYRELTALGKDGVEQLARHHGLATNVGWPQLCKAVWAKVRPQAADKPAPADPIVPGCFDADGKPLTLSQVMACLAKVKPAGK